MFIYADGAKMNFHVQNQHCHPERAKRLRPTTRGVVSNVGVLSTPAMTLSKVEGSTQRRVITPYRFPLENFIIAQLCTPLSIISVHCPLRRRRSHAASPVDTVNHRSGSGCGVCSARHSECSSAHASCI